MLKTLEKEKGKENGGERKVVIERGKRKKRRVKREI